MSWLSECGIFPIEGFIRIDPDHFKRVMPEWEGYRKKSEAAGTFCHQESCVLQEIASG